MIPESPITNEIALERLSMAASANAVASGAVFAAFAILIVWWLVCGWQNACDNWFAKRYDLWRSWDADEDAMELAEELSRPQVEEMEVAA